MFFVNIAKTDVIAGEAKRTIETGKINYIKKFKSQKAHLIAIPESIFANSLQAGGFSIRGWGSLSGSAFKFKV